MIAIVRCNCKVPNVTSVILSKTYTVTWYSVPMYTALLIIASPPCLKMIPSVRLTVIHLPEYVDYCAREVMFSPVSVRLFAHEQDCTKKISSNFHETL